MIGSITFDEDLCTDYDMLEQRIDGNENLAQSSEREINFQAKGNKADSDSQIYLSRNKNTNKKRPSNGRRRTERHLAILQDT